MPERSEAAGHAAWRWPEAMARLDALFAGDPSATALSRVFLDKHRRWFGARAPALSRRLARRRRRLERLLGPGAFEGARVVDVGAGFGFNALLSALAGAAEVVAVDLRADRIADMRVLAEIAGVDALRAECAPYESVMRERGPFDLAIASYFLSHLDDDEEFVSLCAEAIGPGGALYLADDNNALSPLRQIGVRAEWWRAEFIGNRDNPRGFLAARRAAVDDALAAIGRRGALLREYCAWATRGMQHEDCRAFARAAAGDAEPRPRRPRFAYRDPANGIAEERLLNPLRLARLLDRAGFEVRLFPPRPGAGDDRIARLRAALSAEFEILAVRRP